MKALSVLVVLGLALEAGLLASPIQTAPQGPDISGQWNRSLGNGSVPDTRWGSRIDVSQTGDVLTIRQGAAAPERYMLTGTEYAEVLSVAGCDNSTRITKAEASRDSITITTWLVSKIGCAHGENEDDPKISQKGPIIPALVLGARRLESTTVFRREGESLIVDTTRPAVFPAGSTTSSSTYRK